MFVWNLIILLDSFVHLDLLVLLYFRVHRFVCPFEFSCRVELLLCVLFSYVWVSLCVLLVAVLGLTLLNTESVRISVDVETR